MSSEEDFVIPATDEEDSGSDLEIFHRPKSSTRRNIIIETDDEDEVVSSDEDINRSGRLTPSIQKAIRRSIMNISHEIKDESDSDDVDDDDDDDNDDYHDGNNGQEIPKKSPLPPEVIATVRNKFFKNSESIALIPDSDDDDDDDVQNSSNRSAQIITIDSDTEPTTEVSENVSKVVETAKTELNALSLNSNVNQNRARLMYEIEKIAGEMKRIKIFLKQGNLNVLPDKGEKLRINLQKHRDKYLELQTELQNLPSDSADSLNNQTESVSARIRNDFFNKQPDFNSLLKPTTSTSTGDFGKRALETFQREQALTIDRLEDLHGSLLSRPTDDTRAEDPRGLRIKLMPHQQHALAWLLWREQQKPAGGVLADDMGLGKTLTMISLIMTSLAQKSDDDDDDEDWIERGRPVKHRGGTLIVCPASLVSQWENEIKNRCKRGLLTVELYHGNRRESQPRRLARNNVVITTYNLLSREFKNHGVIYNIDWKRVILDEAHVIRNHKSQTCESVCGVLALKRWALTGTPIHNKEMDLFAILKFLKCSPFDDLRVWKKWVDNKNAAGHERLAAVMKSLMLRRTKQELINNGSLDALPEKMLEIINIKLDQEERLIHDKVLVYSRTLFAQFLSQRAEKLHNYELGAGKFDAFASNSSCKNTQFNKAQKKLLAHHADVKQHEILVLLLRLRQVCCHPSLIHSMLDRDDLEVDGLEDDAENNDLMKSMMKLNLNSSKSDVDGEEEGDIGVDERITEHLLTSDNPVFQRSRISSKLRAVLELVKKILDKQEKVIIVSQWTSNLEIVAEQLASIKGATYKIFSGAVAVKNRQEIIDSFNSKGNDPKILLLSLTAGGVGLNLVGANHLLLIDIHWNPQLESQAQDRIYRFGQTKNVFIYKFICTDTIEERIKNLQDKKLDIASSVLTGTRNNADSKLTLNDLKSLFSL
ncbi:hypothetical protein PV328_009036 [Microctonus aethiopoides]|uniref:Transcription termination factor 2 n=1 Tax=Microctonus aethiopoides TaxID=144406 RepID=A0AA39FKN2_9HYME|nr:hypothetical protein PV328_009036 [Microctonus aethiopoides]